jgi:hypothetical protein
MKNKIILRIILDVILFGAGLAGAWWIIFPVGMISVWYYRNFFEFPLAAFAFDVVYASPRDKFFGFEYIYASIAIVLFIILIILKSKIRRNLWQKSF